MVKAVEHVRSRMSDDFDKEAERQRLREKYEQDREDRESTERMSELLLQGATMTNRHCDTCGSPIFRYQGQEFCPNCQMEAEANGAGTGAAGETGEASRASDQTAQSSAVEEQSASGDERVAAGPPEQSQTRTQQRTDASGQQGQRPTVDADSLEEVQASLTRTLARFAQRAAETEDPHRAREYLETAKSAAETLRALPR